MFVIIEPKNERLTNLIAAYGNVWKVIEEFQWHGTSYKVKSFDGNISFVESWQCRIVK